MNDYTGYILVKTNVRAGSVEDAKGKLERLAYGKIEKNMGMKGFELDGVMVDEPE